MLFNNRHSLGTPMLSRDGTVTGGIVARPDRGTPPGGGGGGGSGRPVLVRVCMPIDPTTLQNEYRLYTKK